MVAETVQNLEQVLDALEEVARNDPQLSVGDIQAAIGTRAFGPFLLIPGLVILTPLGGIPGLPTFCALIILLIAVQFAIGRQSLWLPQPFGKRSVEGSKVVSATRFARPIARGVDYFIRPRLQALTGRWASRAIALVCLLLALVMPPLELLPLAAALPAAAITAFGLALIARDGICALIALGLRRRHPMPCSSR
ncbi:exopolysaccharide biosynthesis protein [Marinivivus vitaminiproducens]|uniref:exopolysaccharide biosynthesis protein n=1 Tax=Marinivivus vitaminiproducens TaxID=3035935 RepID=UPI0027A2E046|nr:exopolysaccharide biosynthesis protein [Geminicoccaceae bacterium SCSIO 64248]